MNLTSLFRRVAPTVIAAVAATLTVVIPARADGWQLTVSGTYTWSAQNGHGAHIGPVTAAIVGWSVQPTGPSTGTSVTQGSFMFGDGSSPSPFPLSASVDWSEDVTISGHWIGASAPPASCVINETSVAKGACGGRFDSSEIAVDAGLDNKVTTSTVDDAVTVTSTGTKTTIMPSASGDWTLKRHLAAKSRAWTTGAVVGSLSVYSQVGPYAITVSAP